MCVKHVDHGSTCVHHCFSARAQRRQTCKPCSTADVLLTASDFRLHAYSVTATRFIIVSTSLFLVFLCTVRLLRLFFASRWKNRETQLSFGWVFFLMNKTFEHFHLAFATLPLHENLHCKIAFVIRVFSYATWSKVLAFRAPLS